MTAVHANLSASREDVAALCRKWGVKRLSLFGSVTRTDFGPESDIDVLVEFTPGTDLGPWASRFFELQSELGRLFGRDVDLVEEGAVVNPFRRRSIERDRMVIYAA